MEDLKAKLENLQNEIEELRGDSDCTPLTEHCEKNNIQTCNLNLKNRRILKGHFGKIYALYQCNGNNLVSASQDGKLIIQDCYTTNKLYAIPLRSSQVMTCASSASGKLIACGGLDNLCSIFKISQQPSGDQKMAYRELSQHEGYLSCCRFVGEKEIITSSGDSTCILWDIESKTAVTSFIDHTCDVMSISVCENKNLFASGSCDSTSKIFDFRAGKDCVISFVGHESDINSVDFLDDGSVIGTGSDDSSCRLFDLRSHRQINKYSSDKILCGITSVAFSKTGRYLFGGYDDYNCIAWDTLSGGISAKLSGHENRVSCLGVSSDGTALATGSQDTYAKIWA